MESTKRKGHVLVVGSANMDMVVSTERFPLPGETVFARDFAMFPGGKGSNQAVACAKLGARVHFLGKMGDDAFRISLVESLQREGVILDGLLIDPEHPTGVALITVDAAGENEIIVASGSNMTLTPEDVDRHASLFEGAAVVLVQLEIPLETVSRALELAKRAGATTILNPAPAQPLPEAILRNVDFLTPNQIEAAQLVGLATDGTARAEASAELLVAGGVGSVISTLADEGALLVNEAGSERFPALRVEPVDTTAAGDAFNGALAFALAAGHPPASAVRLANAAAAISVTRRGAQASMPGRAELQAFLSRHAEAIDSIF